MECLKTKLFLDFFNRDTTENTNKAGITEEALSENEGKHKNIENINEKVLIKESLSEDLTTTIENKNDKSTSTFMCKFCEDTFPQFNQIVWNDTDKNCYKCILSINKNTIDNKNDTNLYQDNHRINKRQLSFAYGPNPKWRKIENNITVREPFLKTSRKLIKRRIVKRRRLKKILPCNINKYYLMKTGQLSNKEFNNQCNTKSMNCKKSVQCHIHEGRKNLKKIRDLLLNMKPNHEGWKT